ncbi:hypothetical protein NUM3379_03720 [Kineococcus sp. NUM-3379]
MDPTPGSPPRPTARTRPWRAIAAGTAAALLLNVLLYALARAAGASLSLAQPTGAHVVGVADVAGSTVVPLLAGTALAVLLARWWRPVLRIAQVVGAGFALLTTAGSATSDTDTGTRLALAAMHVVCAAAVVLVLQAARRSPSGSRAPAPADTPAVA